MDHAILRDRRLLAELHARLTGANEPDTLLARDLARYYAFLARELATVRLEHEEVTVLGDAVHAAEQARIAGSPFATLAEAVEAELRGTENLPRRPEVNGQLLIAAVAAWTPGQMLAVLDARERVRAIARQGGQTTLAELLRTAGASFRPSSTR